MSTIRKSSNIGTFGRINYNKAFALNYIFNSMFNTGFTPPSNSGNDGIVYNIGTLFYPLVDGDIIALKFFKTSNNTDTSHIFKLWDSTSGQAVQTVTMAASDAPVGWVTKNLDAPFPIIANRRYAVAMQSRFYVSTINGLVGDYRKDKLNAIKGVFAASPNYPSGSYSNSNYYTDVIFRYKG